MGPSRYRVEWRDGGEALVAREPSEDELARAAPLLAAGYNDPHNRVMIANEHDYTPADVVAHFASMAADGARTFLLYRDGELVGDADFRHIEAARAEFAFLLVARSTQGKGLGSRFARMLHAFAFRELRVERVYVTIVPENVASRRVFEKLAYRPDASPEARAYVDEATDLSLSLGREDFERREGDALRAVRWER